MFCIVFTLVHWGIGIVFELLTALLFTAHLDHIYVFIHSAKDKVSGGEKRAISKILFDIRDG